jgi:hypothetical protein
LMTTSAFAPASGRVSRTASRKRRFIRLRCTAPPRAHSKSNARSRELFTLGGGSPGSESFLLLPLPVKHGHRCRKMAPPQFVHAFEIGVPQQPRAAGKPVRAGSRLDIAFRFSRHTGGHGDSRFQIAISTGLAQQRVRGLYLCAGTIRGSLVSPRPVCAPWRAGGK